MAYAYSFCSSEKMHNKKVEENNSHKKLRNFSSAVGERESISLRLSLYPFRRLMCRLVEGVSSFDSTPSTHSPLADRLSFERGWQCVGGLAVPLPKDE